MGVVNADGLRASRQSTFELMILDLKLLDAVISSQRTVAPHFPTTVNFFASVS
jgi:hypothetical protein